MTDIETAKQPQAANGGGVRGLAIVISSGKPPAGSISV